MMATRGWSRYVWRGWFRHAKRFQLVRKWSPIPVNRSVAIGGVAIGFLSGATTELNGMPLLSRSLLPASCRDVLILLPDWPSDRVLELVPKCWKQTLEQSDARLRKGGIMPRRIRLDNDLVRHATACGMRGTQNTQSRMGRARGEPSRLVTLREQSESGSFRDHSLRNPWLT
jgi:hypothetical protein